ncbi:MAG: hypothetical protein ABSD59_26065 [Terracidiphilus sp.]|jgi:hypothetical protein
MRSELVSGAMKHVSNRFLLAKALAKATRGLHKPGSRIEDTTNDALIRFGRTNPITSGHAVLNAANILTRRSGPLMAIAHQSKSPSVTAVLESPPSSTEGAAVRW